MAFAKWLCLGFLCGVFAHSLRPFAAVDAGRLSLGLIAVLLVIGLTRVRRFRPAFLCVLFCSAFLLGVARFELAQPGLQRTLIPLDPDGFVHSWGSSVQPSALEARLAGYRGRVSGYVRNIIPGDEGELLAGMLYGERGLSKARKDGFRRAGLTHLIAVSGSNVMILILFLSRLLSGLRCSRRESFLWLTLGLGAFVAFVMPQSPVVRAALMGWLISLAPLVGRISHPWHLLRLAAVAYVAWRPESLIFEPSFALSFLATAGVMSWGAWFHEKLETRIPSPVLREAVASTIGATLMTTPYTVWAFGQASALGLLTNLVAVPLVPWVMAAGFLALLIPFTPVVLAARGFLAVILGVADLALKLPFGFWNHLATSPAFMSGCYVLIAVWWSLIHRKTSEKRRVSAKTNKRKTGKRSTGPEAVCEVGIVPSDMTNTFF